jgi:uncharacterized membrane protein
MAIVRAVERISRHLMMTPWRVRHAFPRSTLDVIERAIKDCEAKHVGEICFLVEGALHGAALYNGHSPRDRAIEVFSRQRLWDTEHRGGVLIYVLLADRNIEIVADRGVHKKVGTLEWQRICRKMAEAFGAGRYEAGAVTGIQEVSKLLAEHFPTSMTGAQQLPDASVKCCANSIRGLSNL